MNAAEVVPSKVQGQCGVKIGPLFGECVRQAREPANLHSHGEILSFYMRGANPAEFWSSPLWDRHSVHNIGGRVAVFSIARRSVDFHQLGKVNARSKAVMNGIHIGLESIRRNLEMPLGGFIDLFGEGHSVARRSASKMPSEDQLLVTLDCDEAIGVPAKRITAGIVFFLAAHEAPQFVTLDVCNGDIVDSALQKPFALLSNESKQGKNRCMVKAGDTLRRADRAPLTEKLDCLGSLFDRRVHAAKRRGMVFSECLVALITAVTLKSVSMFSEFLAAGIAVVTGHSGLPFCGSKPIMKFVSAFAASSAIADLAPLAAPTDGGASYLSGVKLERSAPCTSGYFPSNGQPLQYRVYERQRILYAPKVVSPRFENISDFHSAEALSRATIEHRANEVSPSYLCFNLLSKRVLKPNLRSLQLGDFRVKLSTLLSLFSDLSFDKFQSLLQFLGHHSPSQYALTIYIWSIYVKHYFRRA